MALLSAPADAAWLRLASPSFTLITDAGDRQGRKLLDALETVRHVFLESIGGKAPALPVYVYLFSSERDFRRYEAGTAIRGFHQGAPDRDYIAILNSGDETLRIARHEYMHLLLGHGTASLPMWLEEGTAELYSTVELRATGAIFGSPLAAHVRALNSMDWIEAGPFFSAVKSSGLFDHAREMGIFYAQAWALAHLLNFAPAWRRYMPRFVELLDQGTPPALAFESAFGSPPARALAELRGYVKGARFATAVVPMPPRPAAEEPGTAEPLDRGAAELAQVELLVAAGKANAAAAFLESIAAPPSAALETARGLTELARRKPALAKAHFAAAMELPGASPVAAFEYAMLLRDERAPDAEVRRYLNEAVGRNPALAEAHFILGLMAQRENRHRDAVAEFEQALRVEPRQSSFWHAAAMSHLELRQPELARRAALRAASSANTNGQLEMAQAALKLIEAGSPAPPRPNTKPPVNVPDSWKPRQGAATVTGVLEQIDCFGASARFQIRPPSSTESVRLWVDKPGAVLLQDSSSLTFTFACGPQRQPRKVQVEYDPMAGLPESATGRVTAIHFEP